MVPAVIAGAGFVASVAANWPGHYSVDSIWQLAQGRQGVFDDWHPPIMAWLMGLADRVTPGAGLFVVVDAALFFGALWVFARGDGRRPRLGWVLTALVAASPQAVVFQGVAWKDLLFADTTLAGFAALALAGRWWRSAPARWASAAAAFLLFLVADLARQTGFVVPVIGAAVFAAIWIARSGPSSAAGAARRGLAVAGALAALMALAAGISVALMAASDGKPGARAQLAMLQAFDLAGAEHLDPRLPLPASHRRIPLFEWFEKTEAGPRFRPATVDYLDSLPAADALMPPLDPAVASDWRSLIVRHPWLYLRVRAQIFWAILARPDSYDCPLVSVGVSTDDMDILAEAGLQLRSTAKDAFDEDYVKAFQDTPVLSHLFWGALAIALLALAARDIRRGDRRPESLALAGALATALAFTAGFAIVSVACDYRYLYLLDTSAMFAAVHRLSSRPFVQAALPRTAVARRSSLPQPTR